MLILTATLPGAFAPSTLTARNVADAAARLTAFAARHGVSVLALDWSARFVRRPR